MVTSYDTYSLFTLNTVADSIGALPYVEILRTAQARTDRQHADIQLRRSADLSRAQRGQ
jgi:hypothetical protein